MEESEDRKEKKTKLSTLKYPKPFPLINDSDFSEYWKYLTQFQKSFGRSEGLLHFIKDFYLNVRVNKFKMSEPLQDVTLRIREVLMEMSDDLHKLLETYKTHLIDIDLIIHHINEAI